VVLHRIAAGWKRVSPPGGRDGQLTGIDGTWVVGYAGRDAATPILAHWNGTTWQNAKVPDQAGRPPLLDAVNGPWVVGTIGTGNGGTLIFNLRGDRVRRS
jgi:hypothetical protein